jgi:hypothetical protein
MAYRFSTISDDPRYFTLLYFRTYSFLILFSGCQVLEAV